MRRISVAKEVLLFIMALWVLQDAVREIRQLAAPPSSNAELRRLMALQANEWAITTDPPAIWQAHPGRLLAFLPLPTKDEARVVKEFGPTEPMMPPSGAPPSTTTTTLPMSSKEKKP